MNQTVKIPANVIRSTEKALLIGFENGQQVWFPLSQIQKDGETAFLAPAWMVAEKLGTSVASLNREQAALNSFHSKVRKHFSR